MPEKKLGVGILGCGPISQFAHFESVQKSRNAVLEAVCDADEGLANRFGSFYDAKNIYLDYDQMLANPHVEAVIIGIADAFHVPAALKALAAGKHVLCEKPIGVAVEEVEDLDAAVRKSGKILQIGHMLRFDPGIESARNFIEHPDGTDARAEGVVLRQHASLFDDRRRSAVGSQGQQSVAPRW